MELINTPRIQIISKINNIDTEKEAKKIIEKHKNGKNDIFQMQKDVINLIETIDKADKFLQYNYHGIPPIFPLTVEIKHSFNKEIYFTKVFKSQYDIDQYSIKLMQHDNLDLFEKLLYAKCNIPVIHCIVLSILNNYRKFIPFILNYINRERVIIYDKLLRNIYSVADLFKYALDFVMRSYFGDKFVTCEEIRNYYDINNDNSPEIYEFLNIAPALYKKSFNKSPSSKNEIYQSYLLSLQYCQRFYTHDI